MITGEAEVGSPATNSEAHSSLVMPANSYLVITGEHPGASAPTNRMCVSVWLTFCKSICHSPTFPFSLQQSI